MKLSQITFSRGATLNRGNFNSERIDIGATVEIDPGESAEEAFTRLAKWVRAKVSDEIKINGGNNERP